MLRSQTVVDFFRDRYIVPAMTMDALKLRLGGIIERDWKSMGQALLDERKRTGEGEVCLTQKCY